MSTPLAHTASAAMAIERVKYTHDAMIDLILRDPAVSQNKLAAHFGYSVGWVSRVVCSSAFQARLAERKTELVDPTILQTLDEKFNAAANLSMEVLIEKLAITRSPDLALKVGELSSKALGYGARQQNLNVQTSFVVAMPEKVADAQAWAEKHTSLRAGAVPAQVEDAAFKDIPAASPDLAKLMEGV